jgi:hypothetical protein
MEIDRGHAARSISPRPAHLFGVRSRVVATGAAFTAVAKADEAEEGTKVMTAEKSADTCTDLARRLVELRREGKDITLIVGRP